MEHVQIFLSTVSAEFRSYRDALRRDLDRPNVTVKVQEDFIATGTETLDKLDEYIRQCHAVIHLVGDMTGALAQAPSVAVIRHRYPDLAQRLPVLGPFLDPGAPALSYAQWEAWLALYHRKVLIVAAPHEGAPRDERYQLVADQRAAQQAHLARLEKVERYPEIRFANADRLAVDMLRSKLQDILALAGAVTKPANLPYLSIGELFKGRETPLDDLAGSLGPVPKSGATPVVARLLNGMGGVGKTRLALEYAWRRASKYAALLFVIADSREALQRNLAALCKDLNLPERGETDEGRQRDAVLGWLRQHPGWLLILDNIDSEEAATAVEALLPQLLGGHALLTSRLANWSGSLAALPLDVLSPEAAADFLLARTDAKRRKQADDPAAARTLAEELGRLALALEQAGAYIAQRRLGFAHYLVEWQSQRDKVLAWFDPRLMQYPKPVAVTWQTSADPPGGCCSAWPGWAPSPFPNP
ncbi:MAG: NB-ARC domain-containing protein [Pseudomonadota bacterium]|nr:NB-ARC domain-containing protein [Pseudomonadota bacterium]